MKKLSSKQDIILDMGCGSGILSLILAKKSHKVIAVDINKNAIKSTKDNIRINKLSNIEARESNLFSNVPEKFDLIVFNPPFMNIEPNSDIEKALTDHHHKTLIRFFKEVKKHLKPKGRIIIDFSDMGDENLLGKLIKEIGFHKKILHETTINDFAGVRTKIYVLSLTP